MGSNSVPQEGIQHALAFTQEQLDLMHRYSAERRTLTTPTILIVEDQDFSRRLLEGMLRGKYEIYSAENAREAIEIYGEQLPCITFLDIELPDVNGHDLAAFIRQHDPEGYIVMVTANNYAKDVSQARANKVQGFIAKPFSKQKILDVIEQYKRNR